MQVAFYSRDICFGDDVEFELHFFWQITFAIEAYNQNSFTVLRHKRLSVNHLVEHLIVKFI